MKPDTASKESVLFSWIVISLLAVFIVVKGLFAFFVVGDQGPPTWDYRTVKDVPSQSPYAQYDLLPNPQHVHERGNNQ